MDGEALRKHLAKLDEFNRWEDENPSPPRDFAEVLADLGLIWSMLPENVRMADPDPEKLEIRRMREIFAQIDAYQRRARE
jgi:hypothetical protein